MRCVRMYRINRFSFGWWSWQWFDLIEIENVWEEWICFCCFFSHFGLALKWNIQLRNFLDCGLLLAHSNIKAKPKNIQTITMTKQVPIFFVNHNHHYMMLMASFGLSNWLFCCQWFFFCCCCLLVMVVIFACQLHHSFIHSFIHWMTMWKPAPTKHH